MGTYSSKETCACETGPCVFDAVCELDGGLGCNAEGLSGCRFCGFDEYEPCASEDDDDDDERSPFGILRYRYVDDMSERREPFTAAHLARVEHFRYSYSFGPCVIIFRRFSQISGRVLTGLGRMWIESREDPPPLPSHLDPPLTAFFQNEMAARS